MNTEAFHGTNNATVNIAVSSSSQSVKICDGSAMRQIRVVNDGTATVWIAFGSSAVTTASTTGMPMRAGSDYIFSAAPEGGTLYIAAIAAAATGKVYATWGSGF